MAVAQGRTVRHPVRNQTPCGSLKPVRDGQATAVFANRCYRSPLSSTCITAQQRKGAIDSCYRAYSDASCPFDASRWPLAPKDFRWRRCSRGSGQITRNQRRHGAGALSASSSRTALRRPRETLCRSIVESKCCPTSSPTSTAWSSVLRVAAESSLGDLDPRRGRRPARCYDAAGCTSPSPSSRFLWPRLRAPIAIGRIAVAIE
jgi:hypothetical protein